jgi:ATPase family associated with various cellular activities (AAA)
VAAKPDSGMLKVSMASARKHLERCIEIRRPAMLHGQPGCGKSALVHQLGYQLKRPVIDIRLALFDPSDLKGIPYFDSVSGEMRWSVPGELPKSGRTKVCSNITADKEAVEMILDEERSILFLDELSSAPAAVQAAAYQLVLDRKIGEYTLPAGVSIVAAGNRMTDRGVVNRMASPLANRFAAHLEIDAVFSDWVTWAIGRGIRTEVIGFLSSATQHWNTFEQNKDSYAFATPRSWEFVSDLLDDRTDDEMAYNLTAGAIGEGIATVFSQYRMLALKIPDVRKIFAGETINVRDLQISVQYTLIYNIAFAAKDLMKSKGSKSPEYKAAMNHVFAFLANHSLTPELSILASRLFTREFELAVNAKEMPNFDLFWNKVQKYVVGTQ